MTKNEEWKIYKFGKDFDEKYKLAFSIYGEVKAYSKNSPNGRLLRGSLREGYPIISFTQYKPLDEKTKAKFLEQEEVIKNLRAEARDLKKTIRRKTTPEAEVAKAHKRIIILDDDIKSAVAQLSKQRKKSLKKRSIYIHILVHKAIAELFIPNDDPENKKFIIHKNFDKQDNRIENLEWATREQVVKRSFESPKFISYSINKPKRDSSAASKLSYNDVVLIKRKLKKGEPMARLARRFGVSDMQIYRIKTGENWRDVQLSLINNK